MEVEIDNSLPEPPNEEERELMDPDTWDWDSIEELPPVQTPRAVIPVRFSLEELKRVGRVADAEGVPLSKYFRQSALMRALPSAPS
jgi:hypothetical protein